jgi:hypothetical protein
MTQNIASAHCRQDHKYSKFHLELLEEHKGKAYAQALVYNCANLRHLLVKENLVGQELATNHFPGTLKSERETILDVVMESATIDVWKHQVWVRLPAWLPVTKTEEEDWTKLDAKIYRERNGVKMRKNPYGMCRLFSKTDFIDAIVERESESAKGKLTYNDDISYTYFGSEKKHIVDLREDGVFCSCSGYSDLQMAFQEDSYLVKKLLKHPVLRGQLPDRHVFAVWRKLGVQEFKEYQFEYCKLVLRSYGLDSNTKYDKDGISRLHLSVYWNNRLLGQIMQRRGQAGTLCWRTEANVCLYRERRTHKNFEEAVIDLLDVIQAMDS